MRGFIVFGAELPWIHPLAFELAAFGQTLAVSVGASRNPVRPRVRWPIDASRERFARQAWTYPPGFNRTFARWFDPLVRARVNRAVEHLRLATGELPYVIVPEPNLRRYLRDLDPARLIYLNYDDYGPASAGDEDALVRDAAAVVCSSAFQTERFRQRFPSKADAVFHLPHGVHDWFMNPDPGRSPEPATVCAVGRLTARYDWTLIEQVVRRLPEVTFRFVGDREPPNGGQRDAWHRSVSAVLGQPNVQLVPGIPHRETATYYWTSAATWMPYASDLPFVRASCPLKLMDGVSSGRPVISSDVPECRLYPGWVAVHRGADEAVSLLRAAALAAPSAEQNRRAQDQVAFAREHTWRRRAGQLVAAIDAAPRAARMGAEPACT